MLIPTKTHAEFMSAIETDTAPVIPVFRRSRVRFSRIAAFMRWFADHIPVEEKLHDSDIVAMIHSAFPIGTRNHIDPDLENAVAVETNRNAIPNAAVPFETASNVRLIVRSSILSAIPANDHEVRKARGDRWQNGIRRVADRMERHGDLALPV